jgi:hypothetical protein
MRGKNVINGWQRTGEQVEERYDLLAHKQLMRPLYMIPIVMNSDPLLINELDFAHVYIWPVHCICIWFLSKEINVDVPNQHISFPSKENIF